MLWVLIGRLGEAILMSTPTMKVFMRFDKKYLSFYLSLYILPYTLTCVFPYAKNRFFHDRAHFYVRLRAETGI